MSRATVEFVQEFFDAFDRHDESALLDLVHPEVVFASLIVEVEGSFQGHDGLRLYLSELFATFPDFRIDLGQIRPAPNGAVVEVRVRARGVVSGVSTDLIDWQALTLRDGRAVWWAFFRTEAEARTAIESREANVDIARRAYLAATRRPRPDFETVNSLFHPDHELISLRSGLEGRSSLGAEEYRELLASLGDAFESFEMKIGEAEALDDEHVLLTMTVDARG
jgi:ketosteroid isomerase-like protein